MCVIIYKQKQKQLPSRDFLLRCWTANDDGGGFAYNDGKKVYFHKGFAKFKDFYNALLECDARSKLYNKDVVIHFRIATSGGITAEKTHPFEITSSYKRMEKLNGVCNSAFFHNGIISNFASKNYSDTENYNALILSRIKNLENQKTLIDYLARVTNSRFAIITKNDVLLGNDFLEDNGYLVSNKNYAHYYNTSYNNFDKIDYTYPIWKSNKKQMYIYSDYNKYND